MDKEKLDKILKDHEQYIYTHGKEGRQADLRCEDLRDADFSRRNLNGVYLQRADIKGANIDFSSLPLWCGGLDVHIDDKQATQLLYHLVRNVQYSKNTSKHMKKLLGKRSIIKQANKFHHVLECGEIER